MVGLPRGKAAWIMMSILGILLCNFFSLLIVAAVFLEDGGSLPNAMLFITIGSAAILVILYFWQGLGKTFFDVWEHPKNDNGSLTGRKCATCSRIGKQGDVYSNPDPYGKLGIKRAFICHDCVRLRHRDYRLIWIFFILCGLTFSQWLFNPAETQSINPFNPGWVTEYWWAPLGSILMGLGGIAVAIFSVLQIFKPIKESNLPEIGKAIVMLLHEDRLLR